MGMTIDEAIGELESTKDYPASDPASDEALDFAIDIMHKYQKIVEIMADKKDDGGAFEMEDSYWLDKISEALEDADNN